MTSEGASSAVKLSALVVGGTYAYRRFTEPLGSRKVPPLGQFIVAWSVIYLGLSLAVGPAPGIAGAMAILVAVAVLLINGKKVADQLTKALRDPYEKQRRRRRGGRGSKVTPSAPAPATPSTETANPNEPRTA